MRGLLRLDAVVARWMNAGACMHPAARRAVATAARRLSWLEVALLVMLGIRDPGAGIRALLAVGSVYITSEAVGRVARRIRPFAGGVSVDVLVAHTAERSFPSRHTASGAAMAAVAAPSWPALAWIMAMVAVALGTSRVAAGVHYPSDVLAGGLGGWAIGRLLRRCP